MNYEKERFSSASVTTWRWPKPRIMTGELTNPGQDCLLLTRYGTNSWCQQIRDFSASLQFNKTNSERKMFLLLLLLLVILSRLLLIIFKRIKCSFLNSHVFVIFIFMHSKAKHIITKVHNIVVADEI